jgi:hypothetical protein
VNYVQCTGHVPKGMGRGRAWHTQSNCVAIAVVYLSTVTPDTAPQLLVQLPCQCSEISAGHTMKAAAAANTCF